MATLLAETAEHSIALDITVPAEGVLDSEGYLDHDLMRGFETQVEAAILDSIHPNDAMLLRDARERISLAVTFPRMYKGMQFKVIGEDRKSFNQWHEIEVQRLCQEVNDALPDKSYAFEINFMGQSVTVHTLCKGDIPWKDRREDSEPVSRSASPRSSIPFHGEIFYMEMLLSSGIVAKTTLLDAASDFTGRVSRPESLTLPEGVQERVDELFFVAGVPLEALGWRTPEEYGRVQTFSFPRDVENP